MSVPHLIKAKQNQERLIDVTPASAGWEYLSFRVMKLKAGEIYREDSMGNEIALVPLQGKAQLSVAGQSWQTSRKDVFTQMPDVLYLPPDQFLEVKAETDFEFALGSAPAEGKYSARLFKPEEQKVEVRGHPPALREVHHTHCLAFAG